MPCARPAHARITCSTQRRAAHRSPAISLLTRRQRRLRCSIVPASRAQVAVKARATTARRRQVGDEHDRRLRDELAATVELFLFVLMVGAVAHACGARAMLLGPRAVQPAPCQRALSVNCRRRTGTDAAPPRSRCRRDVHARRRAVLGPAPQDAAAHRPRVARALALRVHAPQNGRKNGMANHLSILLGG